MSPVRLITGGESPAGGPKGGDRRRKGTVRIPFPADVYNEIVRILRREGPMKPGAVAAQLPAKRRRHTRRALEKLKTDALVVEENGRVRLASGADKRYLW